MEDSEAIARLRQGDIGGLEHLVATYQVEAVRASYLITSDRPLAEDIAQTSFLRLTERIHSFDPARPFAPWFIRCVINDTLKAVARNSRQVPLDYTAASLLHSVAPSPEDAASTAESNAAIWATLGRLTANQRAAAVLRYYVGLSEAEMAAQLDIPEGTVKWRLHAARQRLRQLLPGWLRPDAPDPAKRPAKEGDPQ